LSRILVLDWERDTCVVMAAELSRGGAEFVQAAVWRPDEELSKASAESLGKKLRDFLKASGLPAAPALIAIGRDRVILKEIGYPAVPSSEEPALVRFQATKDLADAADDVVLDYSTLTEPAALGDRRALAVILRRDILNNLQQVCRTANVKVLGVVPRPFGMAGCVDLARLRGGNLPAPEGPAGSTAVVLIGQRWAEVSILYGSKLVFCRSLGVGPGLPAEIRRCLAVYANQTNGTFARTAPKAVYVAVNAGAEVSLRSLHETLEVPVYELSFLNEKERAGVPAENRSAVEAGFGLVYAWSKKQVPVNLASPKEPVLVVDGSRRQRLVRLAGAATLLVALWLGGQMVLGRQKEAMDTISGEKQMIEERFKAQDQDRKDLEGIKDWEKGAISWIDEFYDLAARFPRDAGFKITKIHIEPITRRDAKDRFSAQMILHGVGLDVQVQKFISSMSDAHIQAHPKYKPVQGTAGFTITVDLVRQEVGAYQTRLSLSGGSPGGGSGDGNRYKRR
jgi:hypothetical protein